MYYYIDKCINNADGTQSFETVVRSSLASALSAYYGLKKDLINQTTIPSFCVGIRTNTGEQIEPWELCECPDYAPAE